MKFKFEKLVVWQEAMKLAEQMYIATKRDFPEEEKFNLTSQLMRAVDSIGLNIAESAILQSNKEQARFLSYSIRSLAEVVACLHKAKNRAYIDSKRFSEFYDSTFILMNRLIAFRKKVLSNDTAFKE